MARRPRPTPRRAGRDCISSARLARPGAATQQLRAEWRWCASPCWSATRRSACTGWSTTSSAIRSSCPGAAAPRWSYRDGERDARFDPHRLPRHPAELQDRESHAAARADRDPAGQRSVSRARWHLALHGARRRRRAGSISSCTTSSRTSCWSSWSDRCSSTSPTRFVDAFLKRAEQLYGRVSQPMRVEVVYALPLRQDVHRGSTWPRAPPCARRSQRSGVLARHPELDLARRPRRRMGPSGGARRAAAATATGWRSIARCRPIRRRRGAARRAPRIAGHATRLS